MDFHLITHSLQRISLRITRWSPHQSLSKRPVLVWLGLLSSVPLFGAAAAFALVEGKEPATPSTAQVVVERVALPLSSPDQSNTRYWREEPILRGDSIAHVMNRLGIRSSEVQRFLRSSPLSKELLKLKTGSTITVQTNDSGELFSLHFMNDDQNGEQVLVVINQVNGEWRANADPIVTETLQTVRAIKVQNSVKQALVKANIPNDIRLQLSETFSDQFDLSSLRPGDRINLIYESLFYQGAPIAAGNLLAAEVERSGKRYQAFYVAHDSESGAYYDAAGKPLKQGFSFQPLANGRITSGFGFRQHPILGNVRLHAGVDYAAATGTPIVAPADGQIIKSETQSGYGNMIEIRHNQKMTTLYAHMSRFAPDSKAGKAVKAGEVIGYVGNTGMSTGAHLHFEVRINQQAADPSTTVLTMPSLSRDQLAKFNIENQPIIASLNLLRTIPVNVAQLD